MMLISLLIHISYCTIIGVDLGSDSIKVAVGSRFKSVHLVRNLYSNEATPNKFAFIDRGNWAFGEGASDQCLLHPETCIQNQRLPLNDQLYFSGNPLKGYQIVALSLIQILQNVKNTENIADEMKVVIAIPPSMTQREKSYLYSALTIAGINCIQFVTSTYAPIEVYVNERKYGLRTDNTAVIIDLGHQGVRVSGFEFDQTRITQKFCQYNDNIGGKTIDSNLLRMIVNKYKLSLSRINYYTEQEAEKDPEYQRNKLLLLSEIRKAREQLTVNSKVSFVFKDKTIAINRQDIDDCSTQIKNSLNQMIQALQSKHPNLLRSGIVQLIGGCSRIPCLQNYISKLLPKCKQLRTMDSISSVCMGACYLIDSEIPSSIQTHDALVTTEVIMKTGGNVYKLYSYENTENFSPVVRLNNVEPLQLYRVIDKNDNDAEFTRFTINVPSSNYNNVYINTVDVGFTLNYFLMPVPDQPMLIQQYEKQVPLSISYERIGWEISPDELSKSKAIIDSMVSGINQRLKVESQKNAIDEYKIYVQNQLKNYGFMNWRHLAFPGICSYIDSLYNSTLRQSKSYGLSKEEMNKILSEFKSLVKHVLKIDDKSFKNTLNSATKTEREKAVDELLDLIEACKLTGARYDDVEAWITSKLNSASMKDIYQRIGILEERGKRAQESYRDNL